MVVTVAMGTCAKSRHQHGGILMRGLLPSALTSYDVFSNFPNNYTFIRKGMLNLYWKIFTLIHFKAKEGLMVLLVRPMFSSLMELKRKVNPQALRGRLLLPWKKQAMNRSLHSTERQVQEQTRSIFQS